MTGGTGSKTGYSTVQVADVGPVRFVVMARPEVRNCLDLVLRREVAHAIRSADADQRCRAIVLAGAGPVFCAGGDIKTLDADPVTGRARLELASDVTRAIRESDTPVVAAVHGGAWGAGLAIAASCDVVVVGRSARLVASFGRFGLVGDSGAFFVLAERIGRGRARELLLLNASLDAEAAVSMGLATRVADDADVRRTAFDLARQLSSAGGGVNAWTKRVLREERPGFERVVDVEIEAQLALLAGPHFAEAQRAFTQKDEPTFWSDLDVEPPVGLLETTSGAAR